MLYIERVTFFYWPNRTQKSPNSQGAAFFFEGQLGYNFVNRQAEQSNNKVRFILNFFIFDNSQPLVFMCNKTNKDNQPSQPSLSGFCVCVSRDDRPWQLHNTLGSYSVHLAITQPWLHFLIQRKIPARQLSSILHSQMSMNFVSAAKVHFGFLEPSENNQRKRRKKKRKCYKQ